MNDYRVYRDGEFMTDQAKRVPREWLMKIGEVYVTGSTTKADMVHVIEKLPDHIVISREDLRAAFERASDPNSLFDIADFTIVIEQELFGKGGEG